MKHRPAHTGWNSLYALAFCLLLFSCETEKIQQTNLGIQQNLFLQSLERVESAGSLLQSSTPDRADIDRAMQLMDRGLQQAYQVDSEFLHKLDTLMPKLYVDRFITGVENYRIGVESASREKQLEGLRLLETWARFWGEKKNAVLRRMNELTGMPADE